jgi:hypothetical protein
MEWSGVYRVEAYNLKNTELSSRGRELNYGLSHLVLRPKIVAGDGLTIFGQFDVFNSTAYPNSQLGTLWGAGVRTAAPPTTSTDGSDVMSQTKSTQSLQVSQLYLTYAQEYGALIVGRAPLQFGLGMTHNAGNGLFDHWYDTDDLVGYKIVLGNLYVLPMLGKASEGNINNSDDLNDYMIQVQYENPETDLEMGVFYQVRSGGDQASDAPTNMAADPEGGVLGGAGATNGGKINIKTVSLYALKDTERYRLGLEASFQSGETGVLTSSDDNVTMGGFGLAAEFAYRPESSRWNWSAKAGTASGDDPATKAKFEGYIFNRNYDVAMLMFNHPLGQNDFLRTRLLTGSVYDNLTDKNINVPDVDAVSNVMYLAPKAEYAFSDRWHLDNSLIAGWLGTNPLTGGKSAGKTLGYEWDISLNFSPRKGVMWVNQAGFLFPGSAWKGDGQYDSKFSYGLATKAAISF